MNTMIDEFATLPPGEMAWMRPQPDVFEANEKEGFTNDLRRGDGVGNAKPPERALLKLLSELAAGLPALGEIQALQVWLYQPGERTIRLQLLTNDRSAKARAGMELALDDSIAKWVWQHQRPVIICAEQDSRFPDFVRLLKEWGVKYFCAVPLVLANRRIGVLGLASTKREALPNFDQEFVQRGVANIANATKKRDPLQGAPDVHDNSREEAMWVDDEVSAGNDFEGIIGGSAAISALCQQINVVAPTGSTALILGETGTGKELIARAIHNLSPRRGAPFIKVNCAAIPAGLIESELFGHERGAFTGAVSRRAGRFEMADGGTLLLDEIGDIPLELQPKLLRVLQEQEFERIGSAQTTRVNVRIVAATSRDLAQMVAAREFRPDLYYRLNVFPLKVPALRERAEDIPLLVRHFVGLYSGRASKQVTDIPMETMDVFLRYPWPGNVRELQNVIERAVILSPGRVLEPSLEELQPSLQISEAVAEGKNEDRATLEDAQREHIRQALAATNWVLGGPKGAGARLGLARTTLIAKMRRLGISRAQA
jgi:formate hydrogenlyase transcriptional activator